MTALQEYLLDKVRANLRESRSILDHIRYQMDDGLTEREREKLNECHAKLCEANDQI